MTTGHEPLLPAPARAVGTDGVPAFGGFAGIVERTGLDDLAPAHQLGPAGLRGIPRRHLRQKRWVYFFAATPERVLLGALVNGAATGSGFLMLTDLRTGRVLADSSRMGTLARVNDHPGPGLRATYHLPGTRYQMARDGDVVRLRIRVDRPAATARLWRPWVQADVAWRDVGSGITAVSQVRHGTESTVSVTAKTCGLPVMGTVRVQDRSGSVTHDLSGGYGGYDYTRGLLPRRTSWRWAYGTGRLADGTVLGLNLTEGFSGVGERSREAVVWVDGRPFPVDPRLRFSFDRTDVLQPWRIRTLDGSVRLRFEPVALHREHLDVRLLSSSFVQPCGLFHGEVRVDGRTYLVAGLPGVVEDQDVLW